MEPGFFMALGTGVLGGFGHCSGMCGPIVAAFSIGGRSIMRLVLYNLGRLVTYTAVGTLAGALGSLVGVAPGLREAQYVVLVFTGLMMVLMGLSIAGAFGGLMRKVECYNSPVLGAARKLASAKGDARFFPLGIVLGFLPCGLLYAMFIASAGSGSVWKGALIMLAFGIGTMPAMFAVGSLAHLIRGRLYRMGGVLVSVMGALYLYRAWVRYASM